MSDRVVLLEEKKSCVRLTINRIQAMNALNGEVLESLLQFFEAPPPSSCRFVVIRGGGDKAFVAGADISAMSKMNPAEAREFSRLGQKLMLAIEGYSRPVVAFVNGFALGGGCELAMACDFIFAAPTAKFGQPEVGLGLIPGFGGTQRLLRRVGASVAADMILTGQPIDGERALRIGLCSRIIAFEDFEAQENRLEKVFSRSGVLAIAEAKKLIRAASSGMDQQYGLVLESETFASCFYNGEGAAGMEAFLNKK